MSGNPPMERLIITLSDSLSPHMDLHGKQVTKKVHIGGLKQEIFMESRRRFRRLAKSIEPTFG
eukprot:3913167-Amphidinium_carterae.1